MSIPFLTQSRAWKALQAHHAEVAGLHLRELFAADPQRGVKFTAEACGLYLDYSKNRATEETLRLLVALAEERGLRGHIDAMFRGDKINITENRVGSTFRSQYWCCRTTVISSGYLARMSGGTLTPGARVMNVT